MSATSKSFSLRYRTRTAINIAPIFIAIQLKITMILSTQFWKVQPPKIQRTCSKIVHWRVGHLAWRYFILNCSRDVGGSKQVIKLKKGLLHFLKICISLVAFFFFFHQARWSLFFFRNVVFRPRLNILIFLPILGEKYSCMILRFRIYGGIKNSSAGFFVLLATFSV